MRRMLLACVSALVLAVPAQAGTFVEMSGHAVGGMATLEDFEFKPAWQSSVFLTGYCSSEFCRLSLTDNRMSIFIDSGADIYFRFDSGPENFADGEWHAGSGTGTYIGYPDSSGWPVINYTFDTARLFYDSYNPEYYETPRFRYGPHYGVPEPATWAMMLGGFGIIGATMRRRNVSVAFA